MKGYLTLDTGDIFEGELIGADFPGTGEVVFTTSMTGYQEMSTDPSYAGQILVFCYPLIGNYGLDKNANESKNTAVSGVVTGEVWDDAEEYLHTGSFPDQLKEAGVPGLMGVDTRALVKKIRKYPTVTGWIAADPVTGPVQPAREGLLVDQVAVESAEYFPNDGPHVVLIDYGYKKSILHALLKRGCAVTVLPYTTPFDEVEMLNPDGILLSNGPGDPTQLEGEFLKIRLMAEKWPTFGICLGHQLLALAFGGGTEKQQNGHRGSNHPVKELLTGKVHITSQNHGYVVRENGITGKGFHVTYRNVNDGTVEGLCHNSLPVSSVQFHPEAHPGPSDTDYLFNVFVRQMKEAGGIRYAKA
ncbi:carbamoyl phosphate synthase small subunit [Alteribacter natronophilus]|uniref:carbamoyl phosphate synthase small subunit n=1 Tax=Alteribacter natronophilus TaxID=2583810 RepID=UPI00110E4965|nr:carbamoyl phosphate synthase small subunit [Alteribacter natronophilus]TMW72498.1 carbamoyl phosphate synthase small subunit [Alteribacter natronophilus]